MKFTTSTQSIAAAAVLFLQFADAVRLAPFPLISHKLTLLPPETRHGPQPRLRLAIRARHFAPIITSQEEIYTIGDAYNNTVGIELVGDTMMMIDMLSKKQVATMAGPIDAWARVAYPSKEVIADAALVAEMKSELVGFLDGVRAGTSVEDSLAKRLMAKASGVENAVEKRDACSCPVLPITVCCCFARGFASSLLALVENDRYLS